MLKYIKEDTSVTFAEIPDEITLCINISNCPHRCPGCHSPYLQTDCGNELTEETLGVLIEKNDGITCVCFMGGDGDKSRLCELADYVTSKNIRVGWYSGDDFLDIDIYKKRFDYVKCGSYKKELGPLNSISTNQKLYKIINRDFIEDITLQLQR